MKLKEIIKEEFLDYIKSGATNYAIFINPSQKEMSSIIKENESDKVRFIADSIHKKIYVFDYRLLHEIASKKYGIGYFANDNVFFGSGRVESGKIKILGSFMLSLGDLEDFIGDNLDKKWGWADRYSNLTDYLFKKKNERNIS